MHTVPIKKDFKVSTTLIKYKYVSIDVVSICLHTNMFQFKNVNWASQWRHWCFRLYDNVPFRGLCSVNCQQPGRTEGAEEDKIKEKDLQCSSLLRPPLFFPLVLSFCLSGAGAVSKSLCPSTEPNVYLTWLFSMSVLGSHPQSLPTHRSSHLVHSATFSFALVSPLSVSHTEWLPPGVRGCVKWKWKDLPSNEHLLLCNCNVTWILMACLVKSFAPALDNKCP